MFYYSHYYYFCLVYFLSWSKSSVQQQYSQVQQNNSSTRSKTAHEQSTFDQRKYQKRNVQLIVIKILSWFRTRKWHKFITSVTKKRTQPQGNTEISKPKFSTDAQHHETNKNQDQYNITTESEPKSKKKGRNFVFFFLFQNLKFRFRISQAFFLKTNLKSKI